jgi:hypothetical protein
MKSSIILPSHPQTFPVQILSIAVTVFYLVTQMCMHILTPLLKTVCFLWPWTILIFVSCTAPKVEVSHKQRLEKYIHMSLWKTSTLYIASSLTNP